MFVPAAPTPSFDFYFKRRLALTPELAVERPDSLRSGDDLRDALLVFCRYIPADWLEAAAGAAAVGLLMDDDMPAMLLDGSVGWDYRRRLWLGSVQRWPALRRRLDIVYVSSKPIADRWRGLRVRTLSPLAEEVDLPASVEFDGAPSFALHQTASHAGEHRWLRRLAGELLTRNPDWTLEVVAGGPLTRLWSGLERVNVLAPVGWPEYRERTAGLGRRILLAPLRRTRVNAARSTAKRIDAARMGAALIVSDPDVYAVSAEEAALGMAVPLRRGAWVEALTALAGDPERVERLARLNHAAVERAHAEAEPLFAPAAEAGWWRLA